MPCEADARKIPSNTEAARKNIQLRQSNGTGLPGERREARRAGNFISDKRERVRGVARLRRERFPTRRLFLAAWCGGRG